MSNKAINIGLLIVGIITVMSVIVFGVTTFMFQLFELILQNK